jgi:hypothetical protein
MIRGCAVVILASAELLLCPGHVVAQPLRKPQGLGSHLQVIVVKQIIFLVLLHSWILVHDTCASPVLVPLLDWLLRLIFLDVFLVLDDDTVIDGVVVVGFILLVELPHLLAVMEDSL